MLDVPARESVIPDDGPSRPARIALYSHDSFGLGHLRRNLSLAWALRAEDPAARILLVTGSPRALSFERPPGVEVVRLPAVTKDADGRYITRRIGIPLDDTIRLRKAICRDAILDFDPDIFVVDHTPTGLRGELLPLLGDLRFRHDTELVLGLRDILDDREKVIETWRREGVYPVLETLYDHLWVYGSPQVFELERLYAMPAALREKIEYLGYIGRGLAPGGPPVAPRSEEQGRPRILGLTGGGEDGGPVAEAFVTMFEGNPGRWNGTLLTGPFLGRAERQRLHERAEAVPGLQVLRFTSDVERWIAESDVVVTMGGYNALMETVSQEKRTLVVPRVHPRREQWIRARAFERLGLVHCLHPDDLDTLGARVSALLEQAPPPSAAEVRLDWDGARGFARRITGLLRRDRIGTGGRDGRDQLRRA